MSWNLRIARPGISEFTSLRTTSEASSHGKTVCGGGWIWNRYWTFKYRVWLTARWLNPPLCWRQVWRVLAIARWFLSALVRCVVFFLQPCARTLVKASQRLRHWSKRLHRRSSIAMICASCEMLCRSQWQRRQVHCKRHEYVRWAVSRTDLRSTERASL